MRSVDVVARRLARLRARLAELALPGLLVTGRANVRYLSGFAGEGFLVVTADGQWLVTDGRYEEEAAAAAPSFELVAYRREAELKERLRALAREAAVDRLGCEAAHLSLARHRWFAETLEGVELDPREGLVEELRRVKDAEEVARIRRALALAEEACARLLPRIGPGRSERELALELEVTMRELGADGPAFDLIVAAGANASRPHARPGSRRLERGDLVILDFGAVWEGYHSDTTRTLVVGPPAPRQREVYEVVLAAQEAALSAVRPGATGEEVDRAARTVIEEAGYGERFLHGTGHGVGLEIHEAPRLSPGREDRLEAGMVVTVEPGVYLPGWGGVRLEDLVLVTEDGGRSLNGLPKELQAL